MFKRVLATVLTILMLLSVIPATLISAASLPSGFQQTPRYYLDDNNGVRWYKFDYYEGWYFYFGVFGYTDSLSDYQLYKPDATPTTGTMYVYATSEEHATCEYTVGTGWKIKYLAGSAPGQGGSTIDFSKYTLIDNNGATWKMYNGVWFYMISPAYTGTMQDYVDKYKAYPESGRVVNTTGELYCYANYSSSAGWQLTFDGGQGQITFGYTIFDNNRATWSVSSGSWWFTAVLPSGQRVSGDVEDYKAQFGEYPKTGTATDANDKFVSYCEFDEATKSWRYSYGPDAAPTSYDYILDNNGEDWYYLSGAWYYLKSDNSYGTVVEYWNAYKVWPRTGIAYTAQGAPVARCTFDSVAGVWTIGSSSTPDAGVTSSYYLKDNLGVYWYYVNSTWCFRTATGMGGMAEYYQTYLTYPTTAQLYDAEGNAMGLYLFNQTTGSWDSVSDSVVPDWNNPGNIGGSTGTVTDAYYSGQLTNPNLALKVYDTNNRLWSKNSDSSWSSLYSSYYTVQNPARYIDSTNRVWEMRNGYWVLNEQAEPKPGEVVTPPVTTISNPNSLTSLTDTKGYVWTKSGLVWTSSVSSYYNALGIVPEYKAADNSVWKLNDARTAWTQTSAGQTPSTPSTPTVPESIAGYTSYVFNGKTYQVPNHTIEIVPSPSTLPYKPEGYSWITYNGQYTLMNLNTGDIYPIPTLYQLPNNYYYQPTYDRDNPWRIVGNGAFETSTINSIDLTDYPYKLEVGKSYQCKADFTCDADHKGLSTILIWSSTNTDVATVDQTGKVTIVGVGRADIKVRAFLGFVETKIDIYGIEAETKPEDKPSTPETPDEPVTPPVVTTPVSDIFTDVSADAPYAEYIQYVYDNEIFKGMSPTTFGPESTMTRAQFYTVLARMAGYTDEELKAKYPSTKFADSQNKWFTAAVEWAYTEGLDGGVGAMQIADANGQLVWVENCFNPDGAIKREDACAALYNFAIKYHHVYFGQPYNISFADANAVNWWAQPAVSSFSQLGILSGHIIDSGNNFRPEDPATRSDIATIIARYAMLYMK